MIVLRGKVEPGAAFPAHSHDREEVLIFLAGSGRAKLGGEEERVVAGDVAIVPANTVHEFAAAGGEALQAIGILPAGARMFSPDGEEIQLG